MLRIEINPARVERVIIDGRTAMERDFELATYRVIKPLIERIDQRLRSAVEDALKRELPQK